MGIYEDIKQLKQEGKSLQEVVDTIKQKYPNYPIVIIVAIYYAV